MEQETKMVFIAFASMTNYSNWKRQIALAYNGSGIYAGREFMFVSPMPEPMPNKDKND